MKIALVTETFPPEINGVAMTLSHLVEGLARRSHAMTVVRPRQGSADQARADGVYDELLCPSLPIPGYNFLRAGLPVRGRLLRRWHDDRPDLVHIATEGPLGYSALLAANKLDIPVTSTFHTNFHSYSRHYGAAWMTRPVLAYLRHFHNRTRLTLSPTADLNAELVRDGFKNIALLARGVNTTVFNPARRSAALRASWGVGPDDLAVIHVSRLAAEKNYPLVIRAFEAVRERHPSARFVIVSDGPLLKKMRAAYPWIHFTGFLPRAELAAHYASADLFPYASLTETFGNVVTEGLASGLPVVAFDYAAAARYIRHDGNGLLVALDSADDFVPAVLRLADDATLRLRLGAAARQTAEGISWDDVIDGLERDLAAIAGTSPSSRVAVAPTPAIR
ncbi:MAG: glycosyltransferase family 1 protein [Verrucomicrobiota bacterium]